MPKRWHSQRPGSQGWRWGAAGGSPGGTQEPDNSMRVVLPPSCDPNGGPHGKTELHRDDTHHDPHTQPWENQSRIPAISRPARPLPKGHLPWCGWNSASQFLTGKGSGLSYEFKLPVTSFSDMISDSHPKGSPCQGSPPKSVIFRKGLRCPLGICFLELYETIMAV